MNIKRFVSLPKRRRRRKSEQSKQHPRYVAWVKTLPCTICKRIATLDYPSEAAHSKVFGSSGMSQKTSDLSRFPLCHCCHQTDKDSYHVIANEQRWAEMHGLDLPAIVAGLNTLWQAAHSEHSFDQK